MANQTAYPYLIGWPLLPLPDANGELHFPSLASSVRQSIQVILRTRPGEQLMVSHYGAGLENYLHEPDTLTTRRRIYDTIVESLEEWEPRILLDHVDVEEVADEPGHLYVDIVYRLRRTGLPQRLGLTMELEG